MTSTGAWDTSSALHWLTRDHDRTRHTVCKLRDGVNEVLTVDWVLEQEQHVSPHPTHPPRVDLS